jgi:hypothetical protein
MKLYLMLVFLYLHLSNAFLYGEYIRMQYIGNTLHIMHYEDGPLPECETVQNKKIKKAAVASGYLQAIKNCIKSVKIIYYMIPSLNKTLYDELNQQ